MAQEIPNICIFHLLNVKTRWMKHSFSFAILLLLCAKWQWFLSFFHKFICCNYNMARYDLLLIATRKKTHLWCFSNKPMNRLRSLLSISIQHHQMLCVFFGILDTENRSFQITKGMPSIVSVRLLVQQTFATFCVFKILTTNNLGAYKYFVFFSNAIGHGFQNYVRSITLIWKIECLFEFGEMVGPTIWIKCIQTRNICVFFNLARKYFVQCFKIFEFRKLYSELFVNVYTTHTPLSKKWRRRAKTSYVSFTVKLEKRETEYRNHQPAERLER